MTNQMADTLATIGAGTQNMARPAVTQESPSAPATLEERIAYVERTVQAMQEFLARTPAHVAWYHDPARLATAISATVAVFAFLLTLTTTYFQFHLTQEQNLRAARQELRELTQRLSQLPRELVQSAQTISNPSALDSVSAMLQAENAVLAEHAYALMRDPAVGASAAEYILVANAVLNSNDPDRALAIFRDGARFVQNANDGVGIYRAIGALLIQMGRFAEGRAAYVQALNMYDRFPTANHAQRDYLNAFTELKWGQAELVMHQCNDARRHVAAAQSTASALGLTTTDSLVQQIDQTDPFLRTCQNAPQPASATDWALQQVLR